MACAHTASLPLNCLITLWVPCRGLAGHGAWWSRVASCLCSYSCTYTVTFAKIVIGMLFFPSSQPSTCVCKTFSNVDLGSASPQQWGFLLEYVLFKDFFFSIGKVQYQVSPNQNLSSFFQAKIFFSCLWHLCMPVSYNEMLPEGKLHIKSFTDLSFFLLQFTLNKSFLPHISQHGSPSSQRQ